MSSLLHREPCLCGSGRPFAACCAERHDAEVRAWRRVRRAEEDVVPRIVEYLQQAGGRALWQEGFRQFFLGCTSPESVRHAMPAFMRWRPLTWIPDWRDEIEDADQDVPEGWPTAPLGVTWLASASPDVSSYEQAFIIAASRSPYSFLLVESVVPAWSLVVRDLLTGRRFCVVDPVISGRDALGNARHCTRCVRRGRELVAAPPRLTCSCSCRCRSVKRAAR